MCYWQDGELVLHNFATGARVAGSAFAVALLEYFSGWKSIAPFLTRSTPRARELRHAITQLHRASLLQRAGDAPSPCERQMHRWRSWNPQAGFFHFSTKDVRYRALDATDTELVGRLTSRKGPAPVKRTPRTATIPLSRGPTIPAFDDTLLGRRTWRRFGAAPVSLEDLGALLWLTFGVQHWIDLGRGGRAMLRTSPSAGARHPLEAYVVAQRVTELAPRTYWYAPDEHALADAGPIGRVRRYLPAQPWYARAAVLVFITAVFGRTEWKYPFPRAYRTIQLEAGHFAQTFCLAATSRGLAPFCTAALADSTIEHDLGIDGVSESIIYACGVGTRPHGVAWAPWPDSDRTPELLPPTSPRMVRKRDRQKR